MFSNINGVKILTSPGLHKTKWVNAADRRYPGADDGEGESKDQMKYSMTAPTQHQLECRKKYCSNQSQWRKKSIGAKAKR